MADRFFQRGGKFFQRKDDGTENELPFTIEDTAPKMKPGQDDGGDPNIRKTTDGGEEVVTPTAPSSTNSGLGPNTAVSGTGAQTPKPADTPETPDVAAPTNAVRQDASVEAPGGGNTPPVVPQGQAAPPGQGNQQSSGGQPPQQPPQPPVAPVPPLTDPGFVGRAVQAVNDDDLTTLGTMAATFDPPIPTGSQVRVDGTLELHATEQAKRAAAITKRDTWASEPNSQEYKDAVAEIARIDAIAGNIGAHNVAVFKLSLVRDMWNTQNNVATQQAGQNTRAVLSSDTQKYTTALSGAMDIIQDAIGSERDHAEALEIILTDASIKALFDQTDFWQDAERSVQDFHESSALQTQGTLEQMAINVLNNIQQGVINVSRDVHQSMLRIDEHRANSQVTLDNDKDMAKFQAAVADGSYFRQAGFQDKLDRDHKMWEALDLAHAVEASFEIDLPDNIAPFIEPSYINKFMSKYLEVADIPAGERFAAMSELGGMFPPLPSELRWDLTTGDFILGPGFDGRQQSPEVIEFKRMWKPFFQMVDTLRSLTSVQAEEDRATAQRDLDRKRHSDDLNRFIETGQIGPAMTAQDALTLVQAESARAEQKHIYLQIWAQVSTDPTRLAMARQSGILNEIEGALGVTIPFNLGSSIAAPQGNQVPSIDKWATLTNAERVVMMADWMAVTGGNEQDFIQAMMSQAPGQVRGGGRFQVA